MALCAEGIAYSGLGGTKVCHIREVRIKIQDVERSIGELWMGGADWVCQAYTVTLAH